MATTRYDDPNRHPSDKRGPCADVECPGVGDVTINGFDWCPRCAVSLQRVLTEAKAMAPRPQAVPA